MVAGTVVERSCFKAALPHLSVAGRHDALRHLDGEHAGVDGAQHQGLTYVVGLVIQCVYVVL
jgi:hypothetical protein